MTTCTQWGACSSFLPAFVYMSKILTARVHKFLWYLKKGEKYMLEVWFVLYDTKLVNNIWRLPSWFRNRMCYKPLECRLKQSHKYFDRYAHTTELKVCFFLHRRLSFRHNVFKLITYIWNLEMDKWIMNRWMTKGVMTFSVSLNPLKWIRMEMQFVNSSSLIRRHKNVYLNCSWIQRQRDATDDRNTYTFVKDFI